VRPNLVRVDGRRATHLINVIDLPDDELLDRLQRAAFAYFDTTTNAQNGLVADTSRANSPCSIAVVGFALSCYPIAVSRGWLTRQAAAERVLATLQFFAGSAQSDEPDATGHRGFYYHFLDMQHGRRVWQCELSLIDTALLLAGMLTAALFFDGEGTESVLRAVARALYSRVDWTWALNGGDTLAQGWRPETGFLHYGWEGYNEATILYVLAIGSPTYPLPASSFAKWTFTYQWENLLGVDTLYSGPLFTHLFSHAWIDFRGIRDQFMREVDSDYFNNTKSAVAIQREYAARNPHEFIGYCRDLWGITAGDGPSNHEKVLTPRDRRFYGYMSRGAPYGPDDGTLAPWAMLATVPFEPAAALAGTRQLLRRYPQVCSEDRFASGFNPSEVEDGAPWLSEGWYGLDQGLLVMMIENYRTGFIWDLTRRSEVFATGLKGAGFSGGWLDDAP
jgi:hypothetical protein